MQRQCPVIKRNEIVVIVNISAKIIAKSPFCSRSLSVFDKGIKYPQFLILLKILWICKIANVISFRAAFLLLHFTDACFVYNI